MVNAALPEKSDDSAINSLLHFYYNTAFASDAITGVERRSANCKRSLKSMQTLKLVGFSGPSGYSEW